MANFSTLAKVRASQVKIEDLDGFERFSAGAQKVMDSKFGTSFGSTEGLDDSPHEAPHKTHPTPSGERDDNIGGA